MSDIDLDAGEVFVIIGKTHGGSTFRPSDWSQRLAGVMSQFGPLGAACKSPFCYSPWCTPGHIQGATCVILQQELKEHFPQAWSFCVGFAKDNDLQTIVMSKEAAFGAPEASRRATASMSI